MPYVDSTASEISDVVLIEELESRGYVIFTDDTNPKKKYEAALADIWKLHIDYQLIGGKFFEEQLLQFFDKYEA